MASSAVADHHFTARCCPQQPSEDESIAGDFPSGGFAGTPKTFRTAPAALIEVPQQHELPADADAAAVTVEAWTGPTAAGAMNAAATRVAETSRRLSKERSQREVTGRL